MKRRIALLQSLDKIPEAIGALVELLDISPTDAEAWAELSDLYLSQALHSQACFCLEEVLLIYPNAWNVRKVDFSSFGSRIAVLTRPTRRSMPVLGKFCSCQVSSLVMPTIPALNGLLAREYAAIVGV